MAAPAGPIKRDRQRSPTLIRRPGFTGSPQWINDLPLRGRADAIESWGGRKG